MIQLLKIATVTLCMWNDIKLYILIFKLNYFLVTFYIQGDRLSVKCGNVKDFHNCQRNVDFSKNRRVVRGKNLVRENCANFSKYCINMLFTHSLSTLCQLFYAAYCWMYTVSHITIFDCNFVTQIIIFLTQLAIKWAFSFPPHPSAQLCWAHCYFSLNQA